MQSLHDRLMHIVNTNLKEGNIAPHNTQAPQTQPNNVSHTYNTPAQNKPRTFFRLSSNYTTPMSDALHAQLVRYCAEERKTLSKAIRIAVYELMGSQTTPARPASLPPIGLPPERRHIISWTMPANKPQDIEHLHGLCSTKGSQSNFVRRAIYLHTKQYKSNDPAEHKEAMSDAWF